MRFLSIGVLVSLAAPLGAQLPSASAAALATGDAYVARARGFNAVAWNPAGLGMPGNPRFSMTFAAVQATATLGPIGLSDFKEYEGDTIPHAVREEWMQEIEEAGGLTGGGGGGLTALAFSAGPIALQVGTQFGLITNLGPGAAELIFFGNAGRTGEPRDISGEGSLAIANATSTAAAAFGRAFRKSESGALAAGFTVKYTMGHVLAFAFDNGTNVSATPIGGQVVFPLVMPRTEDSVRSINNGSGIGFDLGIASSNGAWRWGAAVQNVFNTFQWDVSNFEIRPNEVQIASGGQRNTDVYPLEDAPEIAKIIEDLAYKPVIIVGGAYEVKRLTAALDVRRRTDEDGLEGGPMTQVGAGVELRPLMMLPIMLGSSWSSDVLTLTGGVGLHLLGMRFTLGAGLAKTEHSSDPMLAFTFSTGTR